MCGHIMGKKQKVANLTLLSLEMIFIYLSHKFCNIFQNMIFTLPFNSVHFVSASYFGKLGRKNLFAILFRQRSSEFQRKKTLFHNFVSSFRYSEISFPQNISNRGILYTILCDVRLPRTKAIATLFSHRSSQGHSLTRHANEELN